jgi:hypothetical protein
LVAAGVRPGTGTSNGTEVAELYDPQTGTWSATGSLAVRRFYHAAVLLPDGKVMVAGGTIEGGKAGAANASVEIYDPAVGLWSTTDSMATGR